MHLKTFTVRVERAKILLALPPSATYWGMPLFIALTVDEGHAPATLTPGLDFEYAARIIANACKERGIGLVDGWLQVAGRKECSPERYLRDWRAAMEYPTPITQASELLGLHPFAVFNYDVRAERVARSHRTDEPAGGLRQLLDRTPAMPAPTEADANRRLLWIDLTQPQGAFIAQWLAIFLKPTRDCPYGLSVSIEVPSAEQVATGAWTPAITSEMALHHDPHPELATLRAAA